MILAAGRGERLRPLTDTTPKPLIRVGGETLLTIHLRRLADAGYRDVVINVSHLASAIESHVGDGRRFGLKVYYSREPDGPLETAGGIAHALPLLGEAPFLVINGDIWCDVDLAALQPGPCPAHLVVVPNPDFHPQGDFTPDHGLLLRNDRNSHTFSGIGIYEPHLFRQLPAPDAPLAPLLFELSRRRQLAGTVHHGSWFDIGTPERLAHARDTLGSTPDTA